MSTILQKRRTGLWANADFLRLWAGQSLSLFGSQLTVVASPIVAVVLLDATSGEVGVLGALARAPFVLFLIAGVWADRFPRRPTMIWTDLGRGVLIASIPALWFADALTIHWMWAMVALAGVLWVFFEVANQAHLPALVGREHLAEGNGKMQVSQSVAQVGGPSLAGGLLAVLSAPMVMVLDAVSYLASAVAVARIRAPEPERPPPGERPNVLAALVEGLRWVWQERLVRVLLASTTAYWFFTTGLQTLLVLFVVRTLGLPAALIGGILAVGGIGGVLGATIASRTMRWWGPGPALFSALFAGNAVLLLIPLATGPDWLAIAMLGAAQFGHGFATPVLVVNQATVRMSLTPDDLQGRAVASFRAVSLALAPVGALIAGWLGEVIGLRPTMLAFAIGCLAPVVIVAFSPIPRLKELPGLQKEEEAK